MYSQVTKFQNGTFLPRYKSIRPSPLNTNRQEISDGSPCKKQENWKKQRSGYGSNSLRQQLLHNLCRRFGKQVSLKQDSLIDIELDEAFQEIREETELLSKLEVASDANSILDALSQCIAIIPDSILPFHHKKKRSVDDQGEDVMIPKRHKQESFHVIFPLLLDNIPGIILNNSRN